MKHQVRMVVTFMGKEYEAVREVSQEVFDAVASDPDAFGRLLESEMAREMSESLRQQIVAAK